MTNLSVPFTAESQLHRDPTTSQQSFPARLPGHPRVSSQDAAQLRTFLYRELWPADLERMVPHLWMMSTQSSANICPLHHQKVKGREIIVTEDPRLHLVWVYDRIFIKPLPRYLLSHSFWSEYLSNEKSILGGSAQEERETFARIQMSALGLLRTYYHLIQHESDFQIACRDTGLLPSDISWPEFCAFSKDFLEIDDGAVSESTVTESSGLQGSIFTPRSCWGSSSTSGSTANTVPFSLASTVLCCSSLASCLSF